MLMDDSQQRLNEILLHGEPPQFILSEPQSYARGKEKKSRLWVELECSEHGPYPNPKRLNSILKPGGARCPKCSSVRAGKNYSETMYKLSFNKLNSIAEKKGCKLLGPGRNAHYRQYELSCGHNQEVTKQHMKEGNFRCAKCMDLKLNEEAGKQNCKLIGPGSNSKQRLYLLSCGHECEIHTGDMRYGTFQCKKCIEEKHEKEASARGCKLIGPGRNNYTRSYRLACGHKKILEVKHMKSGDFLCKKCIEIKHANEAIDVGCRLIKKSEKGRAYREYELGCCGHRQEITIGNIRVGDFQCHKCNSSYVDRPSFVYVFHIIDDDFQWLKLGYSASPNFRKTRYGLNERTNIILIAKKSFSRGIDAHAFETNLHINVFNGKALDSVFMKKYMPKSGFMECYPMELKDKLIEALS